ncbi:glycoside hydrolase family 127 protein [Paenibacillus pabuli]|uniref:glycoside hydrolase family 127 protein n=1 Tax=Paenibacillus pabuli TaxID=1472 RepID=UPI0021ABB79C|nr:glycoside hydrolase family 127 protein [Paenibacillus pabuli]
MRLTAGDLALRRQLVKIYITAFDVDRLMHTFKFNAGIPSSAEPLKGWEAEDCGLRGHFVGHFLSACAKFALADQDQAFVEGDEEGHQSQFIPLFRLPVLMNKTDQARICEPGPFFCSFHFLFNLCLLTATNELISASRHVCHPSCQDKVLWRSVSHC